MSVRPTRQRVWRRSVLVMAAASLLGIGLAACSGASTTTPSLGRPPATASPSVSAATGGSAPSAGAAVGTTGSACGLVTVEEVTTAAGQSMAMSGDAGTICTFSAVADPSFVVYVQIYNDKSSMGLMTQLEPASEHLDGMGDNAFWNPTVGTVFVQKGSRGFSVALPSLANLSTSPAAVKANMVTLGKAALSRF